MGSGPVLPQVHRVTSGKSWTLSGPQCPPVYNRCFRSPSYLVILDTPVRVCVWGGHGLSGGRRGVGGSEPARCRARLHAHTAFCISPFRFQSVQRV